jgi:glycosyltransferase involved in cell wall biosynthesis
MTLSVCLITLNEEANLGRTLASVKAIADEIIVVDSGSTDRTLGIAQSFGAKTFSEPWKGFAAQKNSALAKATGDWILSLDADEEVSPELAASIRETVKGSATPAFAGYEMARRNLYLNHWIRHAGFYPDRKLRLVKRGAVTFELRAVHEDMKMPRDQIGRLRGDLLHHAYPDLAAFIEHANRYSSLSAEMVVAEHRVGFNLFNIIVRPWARFVWSYFFRLGFLDGAAGLLVYMNHAMYVSWKYAKAWELSRAQAQTKSATP